MVTLMLILAVVNLALGCALAVLHDYWLCRAARQLIDEAAPELAAPIPVFSSTVFDGLDADAEPEDGVPERWSGMIDAFSLHGLGIIETALWVCLRQCDEVRQQLTHADALQRSLNGDQSIPPHEFDTIVRVCHQWRDDLRTAIRQIASGSESHPAPEALSALLEDYVSIIEADLIALEEGEWAAAVKLTSRKREMLARLLDTAYRLRDELYEWLAIELESRQSINDVAAHLRVDPDMAVYNRVGLEYLIGSARQSENRGPTSLALIDIDRFRRIQQELGAMRSDSFLAVFAEMAERGLRHNHDLDRAARIGGHSFVFFLGNTPLEGAEMTCERLRQQVEASSFTIGERELEVTISCGAVQLKPEESSTQALKRLRAALAEARKAGRNRTCLDDGQQYTIVQPTQLQVTGQTLDVPGN